MTLWLIPFSIPSIVLGHVYAALLLAFGFARKPHYKDGILVLEWRKWVQRWHYYHGPVVGFCLPARPSLDEHDWEHELVHFRQMEDINLVAFIIAGAVLYWSWPIALTIWGTSGALWLLPNYITGLARYGDAYYGAEHERSAYAQTGDLDQL